MKTLIKTKDEIQKEGRWDIDYHLPPEGIKQFPDDILVAVGEVADVIKDKRDPTTEPDKEFKYVDISSVNVETGEIETPQELTGTEAPSRARKLIKRNDILISTCRPTRGAIAIVPKALDGEVCSTGFSVVRAKKGINPIYLHFALRLPSTLEQFRKWSTGSSYPAILDEDVFKTKIPVPGKKEQDCVADIMKEITKIRNLLIERSNKMLHQVVQDTISGIARGVIPQHTVSDHFAELQKHFLEATPNQPTKLH